MSYFLDNFNGSGSLDGHAPDVTLPGVPIGSTVWYAPGMILSGGAAFGGSGWKGVYDLARTDVLLRPLNYTVLFSITTGVGMATVDDGSRCGVSAYTDDETLRAEIIHGMDPPQWWLDNGGNDSVAITVADSTTYSGSIAVSNGSVVTEFMGVTSQPRALSTSRLLQLRIAIDAPSGCRLNYLEVINPDPGQGQGSVNCTLPSLTATASATTAAPPAPVGPPLFIDTFTRTPGPVSYGVPDVGFPGYSDWAWGDTNLYMSAEGELYYPYPTYTSSSTYGSPIPSVSLGLTADWELEFAFKVSPDAELNGMLGVAVIFAPGLQQISLGISRTATTWSVSNSFTSANIALADATPYIGKIHFEGGVATLDIAGLHHVEAGLASYGTPTQIKVTMSQGSTIDYIKMFDLNANVGSASLVLPMFGVTSASVARGYGSSSLTLPAVTVKAGKGESMAASITLPRLTATAQGHDSTGEQALDFTLPSLSVTARAGANAKLALPSLSIQAAGTVTAAASAAITLPGLNSQASATASEVGRANITLPSMNGKSYAGALCSVTIGSLSLQATGTTGSVGGAQITLPLFQATATATAGNHGSLNITLPSLSLHSGGNGATANLPSLQLTAIGSATITVSYEAYAVNLLHTDPNANDEATRYTNFPFTHVVRYQNSYYGANSTGLYLLEGTTDAGTPIPWAVQTALTDFKTPNKKTLASAYFSGRFGPASTIKLIEGEKTPNTYSFTTPRGTLAQNHRQKFGKGTKGRYYALAASGTGTLELDGIECEVHQLTRRI